ncbi:HIRAN domain-containing protein [Chloroflexota bacterium]
MNTEKLYLAWQDSQNRNWWPVGMLTHTQNNSYRFFYTKGAERLKEMGAFETFGSMKDLNAVYESEHLFPIFKNRMTSTSRPEYKRYLEWLGSTVNDLDPLSILAMTEGIRGTDNLEVFSCPKESEKGVFEIVFFSHGLRYLTQSAIDRIGTLQKGDQLYLMFDMQNMYDEKALAIRTSDPVEIVGYCPRYLSRDFLELLTKTGNDKVKVAVERVNHEAPLHLKLVCKIITSWPDDFLPCSDEKYQPVVENLDSEIQKASKAPAIP